MPNLMGQVPEKALRLFVVESIRRAVRDDDNPELQLFPEILAGSYYLA